MYGTIDNLPTSTLRDADTATVASATTTLSTSSASDSLSHKHTAPPRTLLTLNRVLAEQWRKKIMETPKIDFKTLEHAAPAHMARPTPPHAATPITQGLVNHYQAQAPFPTRHTPPLPPPLAHRQMSPSALSICHVEICR